MLWPCRRSALTLCSLPGLSVLAIALALEVSVGKTNTVTALNGSDVLLPCTFATCIGFQDLVFTWYFNSTEMVGGSPGFASSPGRAFPAMPLPSSSGALSCLPSSCRMLSFRAGSALGEQGAANRGTRAPVHVCAFGVKLFCSFCCLQAPFFP